MKGLIPTDNPDQHADEQQHTANAHEEQRDKQIHQPVGSATNRVHHGHFSPDEIEHQQPKQADTKNDSPRCNHDPIVAPVVPRRGANPTRLSPPFGTSLIPEAPCHFCSGPSLLLTRGGHDPGCVTAQRHPVTTTRPSRKAVHDHP